MAVESESRSVVAHDLFWWRRTADGWRTLVTVYWPDRGQTTASSFECRLFDEQGREAALWCREVAPGGFLSVDSDGSEWNESLVESGVLSLRVLADDSSEQRAQLSRLYGTIDWYHPTDGVVSLHSDHSVLVRPTTTQLTEMVLRPAEQRDPSLVFLTADDPAPARSLELTLTNAGGEQRSTTIDGEWAPNRVHRVDLTERFGDLELFASGAELNLAGRRTDVMTFERPYVVSTSPALSAYHGGDQYNTAPLTGPEHFLLGEGEVNPMLAVVGGGLSTEVTFFNTHGAVERDFWIAVRLYDTDGTLVAHEPRWRQACRRAPVCGDLCELVPEERRPFVGHAAFTFSEPGLPAYPRRLQALMAYRSGAVCARIMAWSDEWNTAKRRYWLDQQAGHYLSYYRVLCVPFIETWLGITNAGGADLTEPGTYRMIVRNDSGEEVIAERTVAPLGTDWSVVGELVEGANELLARSFSALVLVESTFDLAMVAFSRHTVSGTWSGEHFMSAPVQTAGGEVWPAGC